MSFLENLRERPEVERRFMAVIFATAVVLIIFFVWVSVFLSSRPVSENRIEESETSDSTETSLSSLSEEIGNFLDTTREQFEAFQATSVPENSF